MTGKDSYSEVLKNIVAGSSEMLLLIKDTELTDKPSPGKWSKLEILGHLIDSALNNHRRILLATNQNTLIFDGYDQERWVVLNNYKNSDPSSLIELWKLSNLHLAKLIENISSEVISRQTSEHNFHQICMNRIPDNSETSLAYLIWDYIDHLEHHLTQIIPGYKRSNGTFKE